MAKNEYVHVETLQEYSERFKDFISFKRENGILEMKMHTNGGPVEWSYQMHHALAEVWTAIGHDQENEVLILTSTDPYWIAQWDTESFMEVEHSDDKDQRFDVQIYDTLKVVENFVNDVEIPTIAAINGKGIHWEAAMMSDITLCAPDFILKDNHFGMANGHVPGDGMGLLAQKFFGVKRGNYHMLMTTETPAVKLLELGVVNEVVEKDKILDRAWEIARYIMTKNRSCRRLTHQLCVGPWKELISRNFRQHLLAEMYSFNLSASKHDFSAIKYGKK
jgi:enoyl-CoA hydratase/carnithine racemase